MFTVLRAVAGVASAGAAGYACSRRNARAEEADAPKSFHDDGVAFAVEDLTDKWLSEVLEKSADSDSDEIEGLRSFQKKRQAIRRTCPPIPARSSWPEVTDEETTEWISKHEEFGLSREELIKRGREIYVQNAVKLAETETPLGLKPQDRINVERSAMEDGVVEDLLSPVDRHKHGWHRCWQDFWELKKTFYAISKVYPGTPEQFREIMSVTERNLIEHERYAQCMGIADVAENDELYTQTTERTELLTQIGEANNAS